jgi:hypothetical protein
VASTLDDPLHMNEKTAYLAMFDFVERHYRITGSDAFGALLGSMALLDDGGTADPAIWGEWLACVERARKGAVDAQQQLKP